VSPFEVQVCGGILIAASKRPFKKARTSFLDVASRNCSLRLRDGSDIVLSLLLMVLYGALANVPFWASETLVGIVPTGRFCLEYLGIGILALFTPKRFSAMLLILAIGADILCGISSTYNLSPLDCLKTIYLLGAFNIVRLVGFAVVIALTLLIAFAAATFPIERISKRHRSVVGICMAALVLGGSGTDYFMIAKLIGRFPSPLKRLSATDGIRAELRPRPVFRRPSIQLVQQQIVLGSIEHIESADQSSGVSVTNASHLALPSIETPLLQSGQAVPNIVLVLVESWGILSDPRARNSLVAPYFERGVSARYQTVQGEVPFHGSTVAGESRELCGQDLGFRILAGSPQLFQNCLPRKLIALGFHTIAAHGNSGYFFQRDDWYRRIGFEDRWFRSELKSQGLPDCIGTVLGTCDAAVARWMGKELEDGDSQPQFIYWVTLNSHLPVPVPIPSDLGSEFNCSNVTALSEDASLCSWYRLIGAVQSSVAALALVKTARPTVFVVVGDHAPPFADTKLRSLFSATTVPYIVLIPRQ
jgi:hypothetical protein